MAKPKTTLELSPLLNNKLNELSSNNGFRNRSEFIRQVLSASVKYIESQGYENFLANASRLAKEDIDKGR